MSETKEHGCITTLLALLVAFALLLYMGHVAAVGYELHIRPHVGGPALPAAFFYAMSYGLFLVRKHDFSVREKESDNTKVLAWFLTPFVMHLIFWVAA
jgi:hypothetical protein